MSTTLIAIFGLSVKYIGGRNEMHCGFIFGKNMDSLSCVTSLYSNRNNNNNYYYSNNKEEEEEEGEEEEEEEGGGAEEEEEEEQLYLS